MPARAVVVLLALAVFAACTGANAAPATEQLVDVGGYRLNLLCRGEQTTGPTVIIEGGRGNDSGDWGDVESAIGGFTRVCSYDRAGLGKSDARPAEATGADVARELHTLLDNAGIEPPYVLATHSIGVLYSRLFAEQYPDDVAGMIMVDGSHEGQFDPGSSDDASTFGNEGTSSIDLTFDVATLRNARPLDVPLFVIHGGLNSDPTWLGYHYRQALLSDNSQMVIALRSGHFPYTDQPGIVTQAVRMVFDAAAAGGTLGECEGAFDTSEALCVPLTR